MFARLSGLSFSYADSVSILADVTLTLAPGWTGVVGPNGAGKTTLLRLISGELASFARALDGGARRIQGELRLDPATLSRWPTLSPGERKRWQVGAALA